MDSRALRLAPVNDTITAQHASHRAELRALPALDHAILTTPEAGIGTILEVHGDR